MSIGGFAQKVNETSAAVEFKNNFQPACRALRAEVEAEFEKHQLLGTQRPVVASDHTMGIGFDASVTLPGRTAKKRSRRLSIDAIAKLAGLRRPDVRHDPVHFRLASAIRTVANTNAVLISAAR